jgi:hypothetical protein
MLAPADIASIGAGSLVGLTLGLVGGGGSILAVPLLVYGVGIPSAHAAIGTSAIAVAVSAAANLAGHARAGTVKWRCASIFAASGVVGASGGAHFAKMVDGRQLLVLFGLLMVTIGLLMLRPRKSGGDENVRLTRATAGRLIPLLTMGGLAVGALSGFFGIGGGFLIVPGLIGATAMPLLNAIGSSLLSVTAFGFTTAASYAFSGLVEWRIAIFFMIGGAIGAVAGVRLASRLARHQHALGRIFAGVVVAAGSYVTAMSLSR